MTPPVMTERRESPSILNRLLAAPRTFSFIQAVKLLRRAHGQPGKEGERAFLRDQLRIRPHLSLGFPATDLDAISELPADAATARRFQLTANFLGLYGPSSPLPTFYTEELLDEQREDQSVSRDFLDVVNHGFFVLYVLADHHYKLIHQVCEEQDQDVLTRLYALAGLGHPELLQRPFRHPGALLRAIGLLTQFPRSAAGLKCLLADQLDAGVAITQCQPRTAEIPLDQQWQLGEGNGVLGETTWIGSQVGDAMGKIHIRIGPLRATTFRRYRLGGPDYDELVMLIRFWCTQPLEFDLELILSPDEARPARLGDPDWCSLGQDAWMTPAPGESVYALYPDCRRMSEHTLRKVSIHDHC